MSTIARVVAALLAAGGVAAAQAQGNVASGKGQIDGQEGDFAPKHAYAYASGDGDKRLLHVVLTAQEPPRAEWDAAGDRDDARAAWCRSAKAAFVALELHASGEVNLVRKCNASGEQRMEMVNTMNGLASVVVKLDANDGKRLKGSVEMGEGACGVAGEPPKYCTATGSYAFDAALAPPLLVDRVWATGKADAPELAAARQALERYWAAAGKAKAIEDLRPHFSTTRAAQVDAQQKEAAQFASRMFTNAFLPAHSTALQVGAGRVLGDAAVFETSNTYTVRDQPRTQSCRILMRNEGGAWKVDKEACAAKL